jgi:hypothetical protein
MPTPTDNKDALRMAKANLARCDEIRALLENLLRASQTLAGPAADKARAQAEALHAEAVELARVSELSIQIANSLIEIDQSRL